MAFKGSPWWMLPRTFRFSYDERTGVVTFSVEWYTFLSSVVIYARTHTRMREHTSTYMFTYVSVSMFACVRAWCVCVCVVRGR